MALNTGHEGGCGTVHANGVAEVPARLEALAALDGLSREAASAQITAALHTVIHVERGERGRRVAEIGFSSMSRVELWSYPPCGGMPTA